MFGAWSVCTAMVTIKQCTITSLFSENEDNTGTNLKKCKHCATNEDPDKLSQCKKTHQENQKGKESKKLKKKDQEEGV